MNIYNHKVADVAKALQLSDRRVQQLVQSKLLPEPVNGKYDLAGCIRAYEKYISDSKIRNVASNELVEQKLRLLKAQAEKAEFEMEVLKGKYVEAEWVEFTWSDMVVTFRSKMLSIPGKLVRSLAAAGGDFIKIEKILEDEIYDTLLSLSKHADEESDHQDSQETTYSA